MNPEILLRRSVIVLAAFATFCVAAYLVVSLTAGRNPPVNGTRLADALAQYTRELRLRGSPVPRTVTLDTLLQLGYLTSADALPFHGAQVTFYSDADATRPQSILLSARMPDGSVQAILADGSVQQFSASRWQELPQSLSETSAPSAVSPAPLLSSPSRRDDTHTAP